MNCKNLIVALSVFGQESNVRIEGSCLVIEPAEHLSSCEKSLLEKFGWFEQKDGWELHIQPYVSLNP